MRVDATVADLALPRSGCRRPKQRRRGGEEGEEESGRAEEDLWPVKVSGEELNGANRRSNGTVSRQGSTMGDEGVRGDDGMVGGEEAQSD